MYALFFVPLPLCVQLAYEGKTDVYIGNKEYLLRNIGQSLSLWLNEKSIKKKKVISPDEEKNPDFNYPPFPLMWKKIRIYEGFYKS